MSTPQINIASLTFDDIKASLKTYLTREGSPFSVYTGSAFDSLLDVFAYNTLFYSFYSNMVANESFLETASIENNKNTIKIKYYFQSGSLFFIKYEDNFDSLEYYFNTNGAIFDFKGNNIQPFPKKYPHKLQYVLRYFYKLDKVFNY